MLLNISFSYVLYLKLVRILTLINCIFICGIVLFIIRKALKMTHLCNAKSSMNLLLINIHVKLKFTKCRLRKQPSFKSVSHLLVLYLDLTFVEDDKRTVTLGSLIRLRGM